MKQLAFILVTLIGSLTIQPTVLLFTGSLANEEACNNTSCKSNNNCHSDSDNQKQTRNDCCPNGICNPFLSCACCCGGIVGKPSLTLVISSIKTNYHQSNQNNPVLGFRSHCYHPPEVV